MNHATSHVLAGALLAGVVSAQATESEELQALRVPIHTADDWQGMAYGLWAAGDSYKASFHGDMTFVPYLGADYPHNQPWSWRTESVRVGSVELLEKGIPPVRVRQDYRYEYRFGAVTEAYDVRVEGLEQTFVVHRHSGPGDLVVTGSVTSQTTTDNVGAGHQALTFRDAAGEAIIGYGEAFAIDANGNRISITTAHDEGEITLSVPGSWLETATFPVTIDPLLTRITTATQSQTIKDVDVAYCHNSNLFLGAPALATMVGYARAASQFDDDVLAVAGDGPTYPNNTVIFTDITSAWDSDHPSAASQDTLQGISQFSYWVLAFRRYAATSPIRTSRIMVHSHRINTTLQTQVVQMPTPSGHNDWRPALGGLRAPSSVSNLNTLLVVCQAEDNSNTVGHWSNSQSSYIAGAIFDPGGGGGSFQPRFTIVSFANLDCERPAVNKVNSNPYVYSWMVAWQSRLSGGSSDDWDLSVRSVDRNGAFTGAEWQPAANLLNTQHKLGPVVAGTFGRYALAYTETDIASTPNTGLTNGKAVWVQRFDWDGTPQPTVIKPAAMLDSDPNRAFEVRGLGFDTHDDSHFAISYSKFALGFYRLHYALLGYNGKPTESGHLWLLSNTRITGGDCSYADDGFMFGYGITSTVYRHKLVYTPAPPASTAGFSCSGAVPAWSGRQVIGSEFSGPSVTGASNSIGHFMVVSFATTDLPINVPGVTPGCRLLVSNTSGYLGMMAFQVGHSVSWQFALPEWLPSITLHFQDWILYPTTFQSTARLTVPLVR